jgi:WD40 repeat protein
MSQVSSLALSADGRLAVSRGGWPDKTLRVWNLDSGQCTKILEGHTKPVTSLALSADGRLAVSGSYDRTLRVWNLDSGQCTKVLEGHTKRVTSLALSADGRLAVSGSEDNTLRVWNLDSGQCISRFAARGLEIIVFQSKRFVVGFSTGKVEFCSIENLPLGPLITTAQREIISEDLPAGPMVARPPCCGQLISIPPSIADRIEHWTHKGGEGGYIDPELLLNCPNCKTPLRMNPFFTNIEKYEN